MRPLIMAFSYIKFMIKESVKAYGKINISLKITGTNNGYHMLDSVCTTVDKYDIITITKRDDSKIIVNLTGKYAEKNIIQSNLNVYKAAELFKQKYSTCGMTIDVVRNIPTGSGMGSSSADISGTLICLSKLFNITDDMLSIANSLGSDSGYLLNSGFARLKGRGDIFELLDIDYKLYFIVIYANSGVNTSECFKKYDELNEDLLEYDNDKLIDLLKSNNIKELSCESCNVLQKPAMCLNKEIVENVECLKSLSSNFVSMTGSGSTVFAMYDNCEIATADYNKIKGKYGDRIEILMSTNNN